MSSISVAGDVSGAISIAAPSAAGSGTLTLPTGTDTLVGKATTDTLTNKTLVAPALGTPASGVLTNCTGVVASALPAGSVIQVVQASTATLVTTTSSAGVASGITAAITPRSASNKILVSCSVAFRVDGGGTYAARLDLLRNAVSILAGIATFNTNGVTWQAPAMYLDSPSSTSSLTYSLNLVSVGAVGTVRVNNDTNSISSITLMEIQG